MSPHPDSLAPTPLDPPGHEVPLLRNTSTRQDDASSGKVATDEQGGVDFGLLGQKILLAGAANAVSPPFALLETHSLFPRFAR
jgi:hypothetical protein